MDELKWVTIISFIFMGFLIGSVVGRNTAPEKVKFIPMKTEEIMTSEKFISAIKSCNAIAGSLNRQLIACKETNE